MKKMTIGVVLSVFLAVSAAAQSGLTQATVQRVIDGDTIELASGEIVRLIGVDTPEIGEPGANAATQFVRERVEGRTVWLEADGRDRDAHGRLRRYVWLRQPTNTQDANQIRQHQLNALLLQNGLARVMIIGSVRNEALFRQLATTQTTQLRGFVGNRNSQIFHTLTCNSLPGPQNRIYFPTRDDALRAGHRACQRCRP
ncbi:MAG: thermonuclease family protein [Treponema sp.]|nr:thermonuclease family protein [Treponema sp.]